MIAKAPSASLFKGITNHSLQKIFENENIILNIDWEKRKEMSDVKAGQEWLDYMIAHKDDASVKKLYEVFQLILVLVKSRIDINTVIENALNSGTFSKLDPLPPDFYDKPRSEQGALIYLYEGLETIRYLADVIYAKDLNLSRDQFVVYEATPVDLTDIERKRPLLESTLDDFFARQKKGGNCEIEYFEGWDAHYFFATLDGAKEYIDMKEPSEKDFTLKEVIRPYDVIFLFDSNAGKLSLHTPNRLGKKTDELANEILEILIGKVDKKRLEKDEFNLSCFAKVGFDFPTMPNEGVKSIHATKIGIRPDDYKDNEIVIINSRKKDAYRSFIESICWFRCNQMVSENMEPIDFPLPFTVTQIGIQIIMNDGSEINFCISPKGCTHPGSASERKRRIAEAFINKLGLRTKKS